MIQLSTLWSNLAPKTEALKARSSQASRTDAGQRRRSILLREAPAPSKGTPLS
jgi:hypothetical protein